MWFASVTVGSPTIAPHSNAVPISIRRATFGALRRLRACRARSGSCRRRGSRRRDAGARRRRRARRCAPRRPGRRGTGRRHAARRRGARAIVGRDVDEPRRPRHEPVVADALAGDHERRARLHDAERPVLAPVPALVLPVVRGRVDHAQVGCGRMVEQLGDLLERERIGVVAPVGVRVGELGVEPGEMRRRLVGERVVALGGDGLEAVRTCAGTQPGRRRWPPRRRRRGALQHHVDDRRRVRVEQDAERPVLGGRSRRARVPALRRPDSGLRLLGSAPGD